MAYSTNTEVYYKSGLSSNDVSTTIIDSFITEADAMIDSKTGKHWGTTSTATQTFDYTTNIYEKSSVDEGGTLASVKPETDKYPVFVLKYSPVVQINSVRFIIQDYQLDKCWSYDSSASEYTDNTDEANSVRGTSFYAFASSVGVGDVLYIGSQYLFAGIYLSLFTVGVGGTCVWEYYNGSGWETLTVTEGTSGGDDLNASSKITWTPPADWDETSINSSGDLYFIRVRVTGAHSTSPKVNQIFFENNCVWQEELNGSEVTWNSNGRVAITGSSVTGDVNKVQIYYTYGSDSTPTLVADLSANLAAQMALVRMMGGSFNDLTSGGLGDEQWTTGEPYVNLRATLRELQTEANELWKQLGIRINFYAT